MMMNFVRTDAVVLRHWDYSDSSLIVSLYTKMRGKIRFMVKGAKTPKSPFRGMFEHFNFLQIQFDFHPAKKGLYYIKQARVEQSFRIAGGALESFYMASYMLELVEVLTEEHDADIRIFALMVEAFEVLRLQWAVKGPGDSNEGTNHYTGFDLMVHRFELYLLHLLGFLSIDENCHICHNALSGKILLEHATGRVLCVPCARKRASLEFSSQEPSYHQRGYAMLDIGVLGFAQMLMDTPWDQLANQTVSLAQRGQIKRFTGIYIDLHLSKPLKSRKFLD
ncbi:MAG: DNA repair protein RecO [Chlamydiota bacterium]|nr:DNA repair protein RecO [Chlamydiota bacterium]